MLPATGVPLECERLLSAPFIVGADATARAARRSCRDRSRGNARFIERTFDPQGNATGDVDLRFALEVDVALRLSAVVAERRARRARRARSSAQRPPTGSVSLSRQWPNGRPVKNGTPNRARDVRDHRRRVVAVVVLRELVAVERAEQHRALPRQNAGEMQLVEHPLDPIRMLADVLEEQDAAVDVAAGAACRRDARPSRDCRPTACLRRRSPAPSSAHSTS